MENIMLVLSIKESGKKSYIHVAHERRKKRTFDVIEQEAVCSRSLNIQDSAWNSWKRDDSFQFVPKMRKQQWDQMSSKQRIEAVLSTIADGKPFNYEIII